MTKEYGFDKLGTDCDFELYAVSKKSLVTF